MRHGKILTRTKKTPNDFIIEGNICKIGCYGDHSEFIGYALVDAEDADKCKPYKWRINGGYVLTEGNKNANLKRQFLHHFILNTDNIVDHENENKQDCRKENLRKCSHSENHCNIKRRSTNTSGYKGVSWNKLNGKWESYITKNYTRSFLGLFDDKKEAALAYNKAAVELHGNFAKLNVVLIRRKSC